MKAFEIHLNGQHLFTAGVGVDGVLAAGVTLVLGDSRPNAGLTCHVGGVDGATGEHLRWTIPAISTGDEVTVKVVETDHITLEPDRQMFDRSEFEAEIQKLRGTNDDADSSSSVG